MNPRRTGSRWFELRPTGSGRWAFMLHRFSGMGLVAYLYLHLAVLGRLRAGPEGWDAFVALAKSPLFLWLDVILLGGVLIHGLNGLRLTLLGFGLGLRVQKAMFWAALAASVGLAGWGAMAMLAR